MDTIPTYQLTDTIDEKVLLYTTDVASNNWNDT